MQSLVFLTCIFSKVIEEKPLGSAPRPPGKGRVNEAFIALLWKAVNHSSLLTAKIPSRVPRERERCAGIILRADADQNADHIFCDDYYLNIFFSLHHRQFSFPKISVP